MPEAPQEDQNVDAWTHVFGELAKTGIEPLEPGPSHGWVPALKQLAHSGVVPNDRPNNAGWGPLFGGLHRSGGVQPQAPKAPIARGVALALAHDELELARSCLTWLWMSSAPASPGSPLAAKAAESKRGGAPATKSPVDLDDATLRSHAREIIAGNLAGGSLADDPQGDPARALRRRPTRWRVAAIGGYAGYRPLGSPRPQRDRTEARTGPTRFSTRPFSHPEATAFTQVSRFRFV
jgi:hypothetical protein